LRVIPVSSGKGGVGKTTLALNFALGLARQGRTILVDLDTGTSSIRNCLEAPVVRDLYHFFKKGAALRDCVTPLPEKLDPRGEYARFGFVAGPKHLIEDITNFGPERRDRLIDAINELDAEYVVLDLRAGLDQGVIDFLPQHNSGILVFTPHMPAATLAASDIVKAILFRRLRRLFRRGARIYSEMGQISPEVVGAAIDRAEDVYDESVANLDAFLLEFEQALGGGHPALVRVREAVESFVVYYVLNLFNGVRESFDTAVRPFVSNLAETVSARLSVVNLGWVVAHEDINLAGQRRVPALLWDTAPGAPAAAQPRADAASAELQSLAAQYLGRRAPHKASPAKPGSGGGPARARVGPGPGGYLDAQLDTLVRMQEDLAGASYRDNFAYIAYRSLHLMQSRGPREFGEPKLLKPAR
jgi:MinD-like ATPase involved in chromosome partitioning or flagellar assembly